MSDKRKIAIFSAGCPMCEETISLVNQTAWPSCDVAVLDMRQDAAAAKANEYGFAACPPILIDGNLADCRAGRDVGEAMLRAGGVGLRLC